jgi:dodecin
MPGHVYKSIEITGSSTVDTTDAIRVAIAKASETIRHVEWFEVVSTRGYIADQTTYFQVTVKIGFRLE